MPRTRIFAIAFALLGAFALTGCSPGTAGVAGVMKTDGGYRVVVAMCDGGVIGHVDIRDRDQVARSEYVIVGEVRVIRVGNILTSQEISDRDAQEDIFANGRFMLSARAPGWFPSGVAGPAFTTADLIGLTNDEVLTVDPGTWDEATVANLDAFTALIEDEWCELE